MGSSSLDFGTETVVITSVTPNAANFHRTVSTTTINLNGGATQTITSVARHGTVNIAPQSIILPGAAFVPGLPISMAVSLFSPPPEIEEYMGSGCMIPLNPTLNQSLPECTQMGMDAVTNFNYGSKGNISLSGKHEFKWHALHTNRQVISINEIIQLQINGVNTAFDAIVIAERVTSGGTSYKGSHWEISWWVKGFGMVRTYFFEIEDGITEIPPSWNNPVFGTDGFIGMRSLTNP